MVNIHVAVLQATGFKQLLQDRARKFLATAGQHVDDQYFPGFRAVGAGQRLITTGFHRLRSEEHTSELQSRENLVCRLLLEKKKYNYRLVKKKSRLVSNYTIYTFTNSLQNFNN